MVDRDETSKACLPCNAWWRLPAILALLLGVMLLGRMGMEESAVEVEEAKVPQQVGDRPTPAAEKVITLTIDSGDGRSKQFEPVAWHEGMTVEDLLRAAAREGVRIDVRGEGASALLISMDGTANEGASGRSWMYKVNGKHADRSFAVYKLQPGDRVLWTFASQR